MRSARLLLVIALFSAPVAHAELGAVRGAPMPTAPAVQIYQLGISDGPDPISGIWAPYTGPNASRVILNPEGAANGDGGPSVAFQPAIGLAAVAWAKNSQSGFDVVMSRFEATTGWSAPQVIAGAPDVNELDPQLLAGPDGSLHLFYWVDGASPRVFYTSAPAGTTNWSTPIPVSPPGQVTCRPAGAFFGSVLRVVYEVHEFGYGNTPRQVVIARYESGSFVTEVVAMTNYSGDNRPQVHSHGGKLWVDWIDAETSGNAGELAWTRLDAQGQWEPIGYQSYGNTEEREFLVRGAARMLAIQP